MEQTPTASITKSYSRKISLQAYGGKQYEMADFFESRSYQWFGVNPTEEETNNKSEELFAQCHEIVEDQIHRYIQLMQEKSHAS